MIAPHDRPTELMVDFRKILSKKVGERSRPERSRPVKIRKIPTKVRKILKIPTKVDFRRAEWGREIRARYFKIPTKVDFRRAERGGEIRARYFGRRRGLLRKNQPG